jgi:AraC family transcriptional regulator of adaptative response/methylated-DNA-[protein]-cysteine methyltransferase
MNDYARMERIIRWLDENFRDQPSLTDLAAIAGLSESHLHRRFVEWAGITPKDFVQCLTLEHARDCLRRGESVLDAALDSGLSGPGRLHDLCVTLEAASPGELKDGGRDLDIDYGLAETPFGPCLIGIAPRGICHLSFEDRAAGDPRSILANAWSNARLSRNDQAAAEIAGQIFSPPNGSGQHLRAFVKGTPFQIRVWRALLEIPPGSLTSYGRLAEHVGKPSASRAVGTAIGRNSLAYLIPCHRVIRETGAISGYRWGVGRKRALIAWETGGKIA